MHIADVSHFVRPRPALDREARERATSVYLPDRVLPMLPEMISNGLASLQPGKVRYTQSAVMEFTADGLRVTPSLHSAAIRSSKRLTYEQVDEFLADRQRAGGGSWAARSATCLGRMHDAGHDPAQAAARTRRPGTDMPEVKVELDKQGRVAGARVVENTESHQIIEEFMLAANEAVAETLRDRGLALPPPRPPIAQPAKTPGADRVRSELGYKTEQPAKPLRAAKAAGRRHRPAGAARRPFRRLAVAAAGHLQPEEEGHYALASDCYCHFTSPIRRYPDLTIHRLLTTILDRPKPRNDSTSWSCWAGTAPTASSGPKRPNAS